MAKFSPRALAFGELALESFRLNNRVLAAGDALSADSGMSSARWQVLGTLVQAGGSLSVADVARLMGLQRQSVQRIADRLAADGLIDWADNPRHRRAKLARPTAHGREVLEILETRRSAWADEIVGDLSGEDVEMAVRVMRRLRRRLDGAD
jgi:DNA-binding MarR family transcriptional regulator